MQGQKGCLPLDTNVPTVVGDGSFAGAVMSVVVVVVVVVVEEVGLVGLRLFVIVDC